MFSRVPWLATALVLLLVALPGCNGSSEKPGRTSESAVEARSLAKAAENDARREDESAHAEPEQDPVSIQAAASESNPSPSNPEDAMTPREEKSERRTEITTLGAGCFWCIEAVLEQYEGILDVTSGYMGGHVEAPTYQQVCTGTTGHAEVVQVTFDPDVISFAQVLELFWKLHDPTTLNRQGNDFGPQYRSAIFYHSEAQREEAERSKKAMNASGTYSNPVVTEITAASTFYSAEGYHQDYYRNNKSQGYCRFVIAPKLEKLGLEK